MSTAVKVSIWAVYDSLWKKSRAVYGSRGKATRSLGSLLLVKGCVWKSSGVYGSLGKYEQLRSVLGSLR